MIGLVGVPVIAEPRPVLAGHFSGLVQPIDYVPYNGYSIYWLSLVGGFLILFLPVELYALASGRPQDTLSAQFWRVMDVVAGQPVTQWSFEHWWTAILIGLLFSWLIVHFDLGWLR